MTSSILSGADSIRNKQMLLTPNLVLNNSAQYTYHKTSVSVTNKYVSRSYLTNSNSEDYLKSYLVTNVSINHYFKSNVSFGFNINNIFDVDYYNSGQVSYGQRQYFVAAPRNVFGTLSYTF